jgi:hypothetical protein
MSSVPKQMHVLTKRKHVQKSTSTLAAGQSDAGPSTTGEPMVVDTGVQQSTISAPKDPNSILPKPPSTFLSRLPRPSSNVSMALAMTSVSQKRKISSIVDLNVASEGSHKRSRPTSTAVQANTEGAVRLQQLSNFLKNIDPSVLKPATFASLGVPQLGTNFPSSSSDNSYIEQATEALIALGLSPSDNNDLAKYMSDLQNKMWVKFFLNFDIPSRMKWIENMLGEIWMRKSTEQERKV